MAAADLTQMNVLELIWNAQRKLLISQSRNCVRELVVWYCWEPKRGELSRMKASRASGWHMHAKQSSQSAGSYSDRPAYLRLWTLAAMRS